MFEATKSVKSIFYINLVLFLLTLVMPNLLYAYLPMYEMNSPEFHYYQLITYQFMHGGFVHILFNMLVFLSFAPYVEEYYGTNKFTLFYLLCGIGSALLHNMLSTGFPLVGASGAIWGIMLIFTILNPNQKVYLFFIPYGIKCKWVIGAMLFIELFSGLVSTDNVSHFGHIGGALTGFLLYLQNKYKIFNF